MTRRSSAISSTTPPFKPNAALRRTDRPPRISGRNPSALLILESRSGFLLFIIEKADSMIKSKFGDSVKSKSDTEQVNEALCEVLCHNICVLIQAIHALGVEPHLVQNPVLH